MSFKDSQNQKIIEGFYIPATLQKYFVLKSIVEASQRYLNQPF